MAVLKVIKVLSSSTLNWEDATRKAVTQAAKSLKNINQFMSKIKVLRSKIMK